MNTIRKIPIRELLNLWSKLGKVKSNQYSICYSYKSNIFHCEAIYFQGDDIIKEEQIYNSQNKSVIFLSCTLDEAVNHVVLFQVFEEIMSDLQLPFEKIIDIRDDSVFYIHSVNFAESKISNLDNIVNNNEENNQKDAL